jgi:hypothetical protein
MPFELGQSYRGQSPSSTEYRLTARTPSPRSVDMDIQLTQFSTIITIARTPHPTLALCSISR